MHNDFFKKEAFSLVDSQGNTIWEILTNSNEVTCKGNEISIEVPISYYDQLTAEGDYTFGITPNSIIVDGKMLLEQHI